MRDSGLSGQLLLLWWLCWGSSRTATAFSGGFDGQWRRSPQTTAAGATVKERGVELEVGDTFFRRESQLSRDMSILVAHLHKQAVGSLRVVDAYSGVGSRAARYLHQAGATAVHANDANEDTHPYLEKNLAGGNVTVTHVDARRLLMKFWQDKDYQDLVDCDSFGYAPRAISAALHAVRLGGLVYVTNTDGRGSAGKAPAKALSAYGSWATHHSAVNEQGLRLLVGMAAREAASLGLEIIPLFSLYSPHGPVYRSMLRVVPCRRPDVFLERTYRFTAQCNRCGQASIVPWGSLGAIGAPSPAENAAVRCNCAAAVTEVAAVAAAATTTATTTLAGGVRPQGNDAGGSTSQRATHRQDWRQRWRTRWRRIWRRQRDRIDEESWGDSGSDVSTAHGLFNMSGPMWVAPLQDPATLASMAALAIEWGWDSDEADSALLPTLRTLEQESDPRLPPFYLNTHELAKRAGVSPPPKRLIFSHLREAGFLARRTHIEKFGLKTDADMVACVEATRRAAADAAIEAAKKAAKRKGRIAESVGESSGRGDRGANAAATPSPHKQKKEKKIKGDRGRPWGTQKEKPI